MRALIAGANGAVGQEISRELTGLGHHISSVGRNSQNKFVIDLSSATAVPELEKVMNDHDVFINASGIENSALAQIPRLIDISASTDYLEQLLDKAPDETPQLIGVGLAPGLSSILAKEIAKGEQDEIDLAIMLGSGEKHGPAALKWTSGLIGKRIYLGDGQLGPKNFSESRRITGPKNTKQRYLLADFPDHLLLNSPRIKSYLAMSSPLATHALAMIARLPYGKKMLQYSPKIGDSKWQLMAHNHSTGKSIEVSGYGQSKATGILTAMAAERFFALTPKTSVTMADLITSADAISRLSRRKALRRD